MFGFGKKEETPKARVQGFGVQVRMGDKAKELLLERCEGRAERLKLAIAKAERQGKKELAADRAKELRLVEVQIQLCKGEIE